MHFKQYGKTFQLRIENANDLRDAIELDESHWVATSAPIDVFRCDKTFISMLDSDSSGRIHTHEMKTAIRWMLDVLSDCSNLQKRTNHIPLSAINKDTSDGSDIFRSASYVLKTLECEDKPTISLKLVRKFIAMQKEQPLNGDGVLIPTATDSPETTQLINDIITTVGGECDASGVTGITENQIATFRKEISECINWRKQGSTLSHAPTPTNPNAPTPKHSQTLPFGTKTDAMFTVLSKHADQIDHFFAQCRTIRFDPRTATRVGCSETELNALDLSKPEDMETCLSKSPLATPNIDDCLPLTVELLNPLYTKWIEKLQTEVLTPILKERLESLHVDQWQKIKKSLQPYADYISEQKGKQVSSLTDKQLQKYQSSEVYREVEELIKADKAVSEKLKGIREVERLTLYHQHLMRLANNFISFSELYHPPIKAMFEEGSAQIDGRWFDLALRVNNVDRHCAIAKSSNIFTLYLEVTNKAANDTFTVAVPATSGTKGNLGVGKRGIFFDVKGHEYDALVIKIIDNPISLREALVAPFTRLWSFILGKIEAMSGTLEKKLQTSTDTLLKSPQKPTPAVATPTNAAGGPAGMLIGLSLSAAAIGSAFAFITKTLAGLSGGQLIAGVMGAAAVVAVPVSLIAVLKLRRQDLSALLEGCGWSINARMRFDRTQRRSFTRRKPYPITATGTPQKNWIKQLLIALILIIMIIGLRNGCQGCKDKKACKTIIPATTNSIENTTS